MESMKLESKAAIQIAKTPQEVFDAIVDPVHMVNYFIADSSGHIREGAKLTWHFPETDVDVPVMIEKVTDHQFISFYWGEEGNETLVEITLEPLGGQRLCGLPRNSWKIPRKESIGSGAIQKAGLTFWLS